MDRTPRRQKRIILATIGAALAVPLIAVPASASLDGGGFFVHAQNIEESKFKATAGLKGTNPGGGGGSGGGTTPGDGTGGGGTTPGDGSGGTTPGGGTGGDGAVPGSPEDSSSLLVDYQKGPVSFRVTQAMVDFSNANEALVAEGKAPRTHPDGWQSISYYDAASNTMRLGFPEDGSRPEVVNLNAGVGVLPVSLAPSSGVKLQVLDSGGMYMYYDLRGAPKAGAMVAYNFAPSGSGAPSISESRYVMEEGQLNLVNVATQTGGRISVARQKSMLDFSPPATASNLPFYSLTGDNRLTIRYDSIRDGYDYISLNSVEILYLKYNGSDSNGYALTEQSDRKQGPGRIVDLGDGNMRFYSSADGENSYPTVAEYNAATGQNWDGSYPKFSDFNTTPPFQPTAS